MGQENDKVILGNEAESPEKQNRKVKIFQKNYIVKDDRRDQANSYSAASPER